MKRAREIERLLESPPDSELLAVLPPDSAAPGVSDALALLEQAEIGVRDAGNIAPEHPGARWEIELLLSIPGREELAPARIWLEPTPHELVVDGVSWRGLSPGDLEAGKQSTWALGASLPFAANPLRDFHAEVRLLAAVAIDALMVLDVNAVVPRPGHWLREVAMATTPPSPSTLFSIHDVGDDDEGHWLHTHGLDRCGAIELDVLDVPARDSGLIAQLVNSVAALFLEHGIPGPGEKFLAGKDLELAWLPWQEGVKRVRSGIPGSDEDRDPAHAGARGILFVPRAGKVGTKYRSPTAHLPILSENPLLYVSTLETERMALLASERLPRFLALLARYGGESGFMFLVKLGYPVDDGESTADREHLWFEVHGHDRGEVEATLLNEPYRIARLHQGMRGAHSLELLSDWSVICERGRFDADSVGELERWLSQSQLTH
jgi:uncharacterized protein YegJ (DUF2314 family)